MDKAEKRKELVKLKKDIILLKTLNTQQKINYKTFMINSVMIESKIKDLEEELNECNKKRL